MSSCNCGCDNSHNQQPSIKAEKSQSHDFGTNQTENASVMIRPDKVKEIKLDEKGTITLTMGDDNGKEVEELNIDFESSASAEKWLIEHFGDYIE